MATALVIVESAAKCKIIQKYLNSIPELDRYTYTVMASFGHIYMLPDTHLGVDQTSWTVTYTLDPKKAATVKKLREAAKKADIVYLASDKDLEGNAIAGHLKHALGLNVCGRHYYRVVFNEITKPALKQAFLDAGDIDLHSVQAQETRRILDRVVGYTVSPLLWSKFVGSKGLSAGRVQSSALKMVYDLCKRYNSFVPEAQWNANGTFVAAPKLTLKAKLVSPKVTSAESIHIDNREFVATFTSKVTRKSPPPPFTTSTLQQECYNKLRIPAKKTMAIAQTLYEQGIITYMRTDSTTLSAQAQSSIVKYIQSIYTDNYIEYRKYSASSASAQEAHEAIRPTDMLYDPASLPATEAKVYALVFKRAVASQMAAAVYDEVSYTITQNELVFKGSTSCMTFDGWTKLYTGQESDKPSKELELPKTGSIPVRIKKLEVSQDYSQPPKLLTEGSIIKSMEQNGIGRPSTYVAILDKLLTRAYIHKTTAPVIAEVISKQYTRNYKGTTTIDTVPYETTISIQDSTKDVLMVTPLGEQVVEYLEGTVSTLLDINFTANMEEQLDKISGGHTDKAIVLNAFYGPFSEAIDRARASTTPTTVPYYSNGVYEVKTTKFGTALYNKSTKKYTNIDSFLSWRKYKDAKEITEKDIQFITSLPITIPETDKQIMIGRYGLYIKSGGKNAKLDKKQWQSVYDGDLSCLST